MVSDRKPRGNWRLSLAIIGIGCLALTSLLLWTLYPKKPNITGNAGYQKEEHDYYPGGHACEPSEIMRLPEGERSRHAIGCAEAREQHRLQTNDLIQQRRSADAADAMTILAYKQAWIAVWALVFGALTLCAAVAAAIYARNAASATESAVAVARDIGQAQVRAYLSIISTKVNFSDKIRNGSTTVSYDLRNAGASPAKRIRTSYELFLTPIPHPAPQLGNTSNPPASLMPGAYGTERHSLMLRFPKVK